MKRVLGVEFGNSALKLALCEGEHIKKLAVAPLPENLIEEGRVTSPEAMAAFLRQTLKNLGWSVRRAAMVLPSAQVFVRRTTVPAMPVDQLTINLPYEFRDYITEEKDRYEYDYAVLESKTGEDGEVSELDLLAVAARKDVIARYRDLFRWAGLKLETAIPNEAAYANLIRAHGDGNEDKERCIIDLGHGATRLYIYTGTKLEVVRHLDVGGAAIDNVIAAATDTDPHTAGLRKVDNHDGVWDLPACIDTYQAAAVDILRALNFYRYNNPSSELGEMLLCGGGVRMAPLVEQLRRTLETDVRIVSDEDLSEADGAAELPLCLAAVGAAIQ